MANIYGILILKMFHRSRWETSIVSLGGDTLVGDRRYTYAWKYEYGCISSKTHSRECSPLDFLLLEQKDLNGHKRHVAYALNSKLDVVVNHTPKSKEEWSLFSFRIPSNSEFPKMELVVSLSAYTDSQLVIIDWQFEINEPSKEVMIVMTNP